MKANYPLPDHKWVTLKPTTSRDNVQIPVRALDRDAGL